MIAHSIFFYFLSIIAIFSALMVITSRSTINSVFLILDFISVGCLFIMVGAEFLGMVLLIIYVGAVAVLLLCCNDAKCCTAKTIMVYW